MSVRAYPGGVEAKREVSITAALPANATPVSVPMTFDGGAVVAAQEGRLTTMTASTTTLVCATLTFDTNIVGSVITMKSGLNAGLWRVVKTRSSTTQIVTDAFPSNCVAGDQFIVSKPAVLVHKAVLWIPDPTFPFADVVYVALGPVVAGAKTPGSVRVSPGAFIPLVSAEGFTSISLYAAANYSAYDYCVRAI